MSEDVFLKEFNNLNITPEVGIDLETVQDTLSGLGVSGMYTGVYGKENKKIRAYKKDKYKLTFGESVMEDKPTRHETKKPSIADIQYHKKHETEKPSISSHIYGESLDVSDLMDDIRVDERNRQISEDVEREVRAESSVYRRKRLFDKMKKNKHNLESDSEHEDLGDIDELLNEMEADKQIKQDEYINLNPPQSPKNEQLGEEPDIAFTPVLTQQDEFDDYFETFKEPTEHKHDTNDELDIKEEKDEGLRIHDNALGGNGDLMNESDLNYVDLLDDGHHDDPLHDDPLHDEPSGELHEGWFDDILRESGIPRPERRHHSQVSDRGNIHDWEGGAGDGPENIGLNDYIRDMMLESNEEKYGNVLDTSELTEGFEDILKGSDIPQNIRNLQFERRAMARGDTKMAARLRESNKAYRTSTGSMRKKQKEEGKRKKNDRNRYDQVSLVRESNLNHLRSISELLPTL
jgi:hypothetical protein